MLEYELLDLPVPIIKFFDVKLVKHANSNTLQKAWRIDRVVSHTLNIPDPVHVAEIETVRVVLIWSLHQIYFKRIRLKIGQVLPKKECTSLIECPKGPVVSLDEE